MSPPGGATYFVTAAPLRIVQAVAGPEPGASQAPSDGALGQLFLRARAILAPSLEKYDQEYGTLQQKMQEKNQLKIKQKMKVVKVLQREVEYYLH